MYSRIITTNKKNRLNQTTSIHDPLLTNNLQDRHPHHYALQAINRKPEYYSFPQDPNYLNASRQSTEDDDDNISPRKKMCSIL